MARSGGCWHGESTVWPGGVSNKTRRPWGSY
jgi:hypothetical protein